MDIKIKDILEFLNNGDDKIEFNGDEDEKITGYSTIANYNRGTVTWIKNSEKYLEYKDKISEIQLLITGTGVLKETLPLNVIVTDNPKNVFFSILREYFSEKVNPGIGKNTVIDESAKISDNVYIGHNCVIESGVVIGENTIINHNVTIRKNVIIGKRCEIKSGSVLGEEGYGYSKQNGRFVKVPHFGRVVIGDDVEIGSNTVIDRGTMDDTYIGDGCKINNLCHIGHNVRIGNYVRIMIGTMICGSTVIHDYAYLAPGSIVKNQLEIGSDSVIGMGSVVIDNVQEGKVVVGVPGKVIRDNVGKKL
ncbi:MAG: hypothetical protein HDT39_08975 [Lachnospiraceae bacterium]|nr:hypothetical protein [Lachnospiraceae bacterium]